MEIKKQVVLRTVAGESMLIPVGETVLSYNGIFMLTQSGRLLWEQIVNGANESDLVATLIKEYEIDEKTAVDDTKDFLNSLAEFGII